MAVNGRERAESAELAPQEKISARGGRGLPEEFTDRLLAGLFAETNRTTLCPNPSSISNHRLAMGVKAMPTKACCYGDTAAPDYASHSQRFLTSLRKTVRKVG